MSTARFNTLANAAGSKSVPVDTVVDGSAKAWVNFNGTGTVAIRQAFNCSSIVDNGVGDFTINFATAMTDTNYVVASSAQLDNAGTANGDVIAGAHRSSTSHSTTSYRTSTVSSGGTVVDPISYEMVVSVELKGRADV